MSAPAWPGLFATPSEVLAWLNQQRPASRDAYRCVLAVRWLVLAELDRSVPELPQQPLPGPEAGG